LQQSGVECMEVTVPDDLAGLLEAQKTVMGYEAWASYEALAASQGDGFSRPFAQLLETGRQVARADYDQAQALAARGRAWLGSALESFDAWVVPAAPGPAPAGITATGDPVFSRVWTLLGVPCVTVPGLKAANGLPLGVQLIAPARADRALLAAAAAVRRALAAAVGGLDPVVSETAG